jgi:hypothetical protein
MTRDDGERAVALHNKLLHLWGFPTQDMECLHSR